MATMFGFLLSTSIFTFQSAWYVIIPFLFFLVVLYLSKMVSLSSMMAALISSLYITYRQFDSSIEIIIASWLLTILVIYRHRSNIKKIADGTENKICIGTGAFAGTGLAAKGTALGDRKCTSKLAYLEELIDRYYLGDKDEEKLQEGLYAGLLYGLDDPYSRYYTAEEYDSENSSNEGSYVGIGILMEKNKEGGVKIVECYEGGPGEKAGLEEGDIISAIDGEDITEDEVSDVADIVRNSDKDSVVLTVHREGAEDAMEITVPVTDVELPSVFHEMLDSKIGYIRITQFTGVTGEQYQEAFDDLQKQGMEKMIVDLRDNPGGLLDSVCDVLRKILPEGLIVYTEDKDGNREEEKCDGKNELRIPLAVLVNESSASASEIFAGAVQDYGIGTIVGTTTYGKGVVQSIRQLSDGSAIKLTVANYYTPKGNNINKTGIKPDIEVSLDTSLLNKNKDEITHDEDNQLQKAIKAVEKEK